MYPLIVLCGILVMSHLSQAEEFRLQLRSQKETVPRSGAFERTSVDAVWTAEETAVIVCDVWDKHHCLNAVRRMEEFLPRMNSVLNEARMRGATIIHSPSDCMPAYESHPARRRAVEAPAAETSPVNVEFWCSKIPGEEQAFYPIDQSDGGEDDDPAEHARWAAELKALGRNPGLPWKSQNDMISIDKDADFISDRGDEVWNILESRHIKNVILVGVHTNMCVLGRPFGLRQLVRNGKNVVLMRDMTDCMYNPQRWPYVDHFTGNDLIVSHVERFVCPTISSDQILGGRPFVSKYDKRTARDVMSVDAGKPDSASFAKHWTTALIGSSWSDATEGTMTRVGDPVWLRCSVRLPSSWLSEGGLKLSLNNDLSDARVWLNGNLLQVSADGSLTIPRDTVTADDINLLVMRTKPDAMQQDLPSAPVIHGHDRTLKLDGRWQFRVGDDPSWSNIPLPAKFGLGSDVLFEAE